jgi:hypothetical protein
MIYNLILNSASYLRGGSDQSQRVYGVDWTFLPGNKKFKVRFSFVCKSSTYSFSNIYMVGANIGTIPLNYEGSSTTQTQSKTSLIIGALKTVAGNPIVGTDLSLIANYGDNPPFVLLTRPTNNQIEILIWKNTPSTSAGITTDYILILSFEEFEE